MIWKDIMIWKGIIWLLGKLNMLMSHVYLVFALIYGEIFLLRSLLTVALFRFLLMYSICTMQGCPCRKKWLKNQFMLMLSSIEGSCSEDSHVLKLNLKRSR